MKYGPHELKKLIADLKDDQQEVRHIKTVERYEIIRGELLELVLDLEQEGWGQ
jgi:hypothetical protein